MELGAKRGELVQLMEKFVPQTHVGIFRNEQTQSTPLDPNLIFGVFHSVSVHLGSFRNFKKHGAKRGKMVQLMQKFVPRSHNRIFRTESTPLDPKLMFWSVS